MVTILNQDWTVRVSYLPSATICESAVPFPSASIRESAVPFPSASIRESAVKSAYPRFLRPYLTLFPVRFQFILKSPNERARLHPIGLFRIPGIQHFTTAPVEGGGAGTPWFEPARPPARGKDSVHPPGAGQIGGFSLSVWRPKPHRHVRYEAGPTGRHSWTAQGDEQFSGRTPGQRPAAAPGEGDEQGDIDPEHA